eukprot:ANDGO_06512.mRNA.1 ABC transporter F family member 1
MGRSAKEKKAAKSASANSLPDVEESTTNHNSSDNLESIESGISGMHMSAEDNGSTTSTLVHDAYSIQERAKYRTANGVMLSEKRSNDIHIGSCSLSLHGRELISDATLHLNSGGRYGLIADNGAGKTTLLDALAAREFPIPAHIDVYQMREEVPPLHDVTVFEAVVCDLDVEVARLEAEADRVMDEEGPESPLLTDIYERLDELEPEKAKARAHEILFGLGFTQLMQQRPCSEFSGGWRMRVALAKALWIRPTCLLLDEPSNHLDVESVIWLEEHLKESYDDRHILLLVSHAQDFLNEICTHILHLTPKKKLVAYSGNYDQFIETRLEVMQNQAKLYARQQHQAAQIKQFIARFSAGSRASQAKSREKMLEKMQAEGTAVERVDTGSLLGSQQIRIKLPQCGKLPLPVLQVRNVTFAYPSKNGDSRCIFNKVDWGVDCDSRVALVGPNGAGKSTLMKLLSGELQPSDGMVNRHHHLRIFKMDQHTTKQVDGNMTPLEWMLKSFPEEITKDTVRSAVGMYGITGEQQNLPIRMLSDGQKCRLVFAMMRVRSPHILLLDEPTNHLDMATIDALGDCINSYEGGLVLVSHDFRLISQVAEEIWICEDQKISRFSGDIMDYKNQLREKIKNEGSLKAHSQVHP